MQVKALLLRNFRSYEKAQFTFGPQNNLIIGPNARGKTTILEAIYLLITGRSFRSRNLDEMVREGESGFYVEALYENQEIDHSIRFIYEKRQRQIYTNRHPCRSLSDLIGQLQGALMLPDDVQLVKGAPSRRREFLDLQLAQMNPLYVHHLTRYSRAMQQRNTLLKAQNEQAIDLFEKEMAASGAYLIAERKRIVDLLAQDCARVQDRLSLGKETVSLDYLAKHSPENLSEQYEKMRKREMKMGFSLIGPHLDDLTLKLGDREARLFASEGQKKSLTTALKFAEWIQLNTHSDSVPLMLIDDVGVSLDGGRRERLISLLDTFSQVFVTSTEPLNFHSDARETNHITL
ncbi:DNA replication and repair protein recF [Waddlia chondrophila 2032/99]|uniref:DNA replication and repair protein RecF n=2 Tax=Waddlia chondrophila TaxID=71667 RepID=D6YWM5_WADCW|nr:DNA replication and repair protein RecF [Waddlia chondrophila]ADI38536.1 putative DNA replication and repair protein recF [Waddlia chondrophila WSU 86-1044]CCB91619.1 DNA replication and repair protein recF [Waddlia chondrophila 2032/99]